MSIISISKIAPTFQFRHFYGIKFDVATNPWSHHVQADELSEDESTPSFKYENYWG